MMSLNPKAAAVVVLVVLAATVAAAIPFQKRRARVALPGGGTATVSTPSLFGVIRGARSTLRYERAGQTVTADVLHTLLEQPITLLAGPSSGTVLCVYDFDVGYRVIAFDVNGAQSEASDELKIIVPRSDMAARHASVEEIAFAAERIGAMPQEAFEATSLPTLDLGLLQVYARRANVVARLGEALSRERNRVVAASH